MHRTLSMPSLLLLSSLSLTLIPLSNVVSSEGVTYLHEYGLYKYNGESDAVIQDGGWHLASVEEMNGLKEDFIAYYNLLGGLKAISTFDSNSCCMRTGVSWLVIRDHDLCPHDAVSGFVVGQYEEGDVYMFSESTSPYEDLVPLYMNDTFSDDDPNAAECGHTDENPAIYFRYRYGFFDITRSSEISDAGWQLATLEDVEDDRYFLNLFYNVYGGIPAIDTWDAQSHALFWERDDSTQMGCTFNNSNWQVFTADVNGTVDSDFVKGHIQKLVLNELFGTHQQPVNELTDDYSFLSFSASATYDDCANMPALYTRGQTWIGYTWPPTSSPTMVTGMPTSMTSVPTEYPTEYPTTNPTFDPTVNPSANPTMFPSKNPTVDPTANPTGNPTGNPTAFPTGNPSANPTSYPTVNPTGVPSQSPTFGPTPISDSPTGSPTPNPSYSPTQVTASPVVSTPPPSQATPSPVIATTTEDIVVGGGDGDGNAGDEDGNELNNGGGSGTLLNTTGWIVLGILALTALCCLCCCFLALRRRDLDKKNRKINKLKRELRNEQKANYANEMDDMDLTGIDMQAGMMRDPSLVPINGPIIPTNTLDTVGRPAGFSAADDGQFSVDGYAVGGAGAMVGGIGAAPIANGGRGNNGLFLPASDPVSVPMDTNGQAVSLLLAGNGGAQSPPGGAGGFVQMAALNGAAPAAGAAAGVSQPMQVMIMDPSSGRLIPAQIQGGALAAAGLAGVAGVAGASALAAPAGGESTDTSHRGEGKHPIEHPAEQQYITPHDDDAHEFEAAKAHGESEDSDEPSLMLAKEGAGYLSGKQGLTDDYSGRKVGKSDGDAAPSEGAVVTGSHGGFESVDSKRRLMAYSIPDSSHKLDTSVGMSEDDEELYD